MILSRLFLWFLCYSIVGWVYETIVCSISERKFVSRGFLEGPYCPIYGAGALLDLFLLGWISNPLILFFAGMLVTGVLEYLTSWILEELFHARWWDYSQWKWNINGRICLVGVLVFGVMSVLLVYWIHPFVVAMTSKIPVIWIHILSIVLFALFLWDTVTTIIHMQSFNTKLKRIQQKINALTEEAVSYKEERKEAVKQRLASIRETGLRELVYELVRKLPHRDRRMLRSFPKFHSTRYEEIVEKIREVLRRDK